jgi:putative DNA primase/helicase
MASADELKKQAADRWPEIISRLTGLPESILDTKHHPCPKCGGEDRFNLDRDGSGGVFCNQCQPGTGSGIDTIMWLNGWDFNRTRQQLADYLNPPIVVSDDVRKLRHATYTKLASVFGIDAKHQTDLAKRGLSELEIKHRGYWTSPGQAHIKLMENFDSLGRVEISKSVPGVMPGGSLTLAAREALMIPVRNADGEIVGIQYRPDNRGPKGPKYLWLSSKDSGVSPGSPCHFALTPADAECKPGIVRLTEGPLKADIATAISGIKTLAIAGVNNWKVGVAAVQSLNPSAVWLAFDSDASTNIAVARAVVDVFDALTVAGLQVHFEAWTEDHKGIDDALAAGVEVEVFSIDATANRIDSLRAFCLGKQNPEQFEHPDDPHRLARVNLSRYQDLGRSIRYWKGTWYSYRGTHYVEIDKDHFLARINASIKEEFDRIRAEEHVTYEKWKKSKNYDPDKDKGPPKSRKVTDSLSKNVLEATKSMQIMRQTQRLDSWLDGGPDECISCENGIINVRALVSGSDEQVLIDHSPNWFSTVTLPYRYDPEADCPAWKAFLHDIFNGDVESIAALQQWMGYLLVKSDNSLNKVLFVIGKPRSGKGTILNIIRAVLGEQNIATPTLSEMGEKFGLESLVGKSAALIADARMSDRTDETIVTERLLSISGNDPQNIQRKYKPTMTGYRMNVRFTLFSNLIPKLKDFSSAFVTRCIFLHTPNCYLGREDVHLSAKLAAELPGILNWCIAGRQMLEEGNWRLKQPESGESLVREMNAMTSPVRSFVDDICEIGTGFECTTSDLFRSWEVWCHENDIAHPGTIQSFSRKIKAVEPLIDTSQKRIGRERFRVFLNVRERVEEEQPSESESRDMF